MMLGNNNLAFVVATIIPAAVYSLLVWTATPDRAVRLKIAMLYLIMGMAVAWTVSFFHWIFPQWDDALSGNVTVAAFLLAFFQVAVLEESSKFMAFRLADSYRSRHWFEHPSATMFYAMSVGAGFAIIENLTYVQAAQQTATYMVQIGLATSGETMGRIWELVLIRSTTSMLLHMMCGLIVGYFIAIYKNKLDSGVTSSWGPFARRIWFSGVAIFMAAIFHGMYDFNLFSQADASTESVLGLIAIGFGVTYLMSKRMFNIPFREQDPPLR